MSVTITNVHEGPSPRSVIVTWSSDIDNATFYIWQDGELIMETFRTSLTMTLQDDQSNLLSVFDDPGHLPPSTKKSDGIIRFDDDGFSQRYRIYTKDGGTLTLEQEIEASTIDETHEYRTPRIDDVDGQTFQIHSVRDNVESTPTTLVVNIVRVPDPPLVDAVFSNATKKLTFSQA